MDTFFSKNYLASVPEDPVFKKPENSVLNDKN